MTPGDFPSTRDWERVQSLFERMLASEDPNAIQAEETDSEVARAAAKLYADHYRAEAAKFLDEPVKLTAEDWSGRTLGNFQILSKLGEGGMGAVYLAKDLTLGRQVALKFLSLRVANSASVLERFRLEARAAAALKHPNICTIYGVEDWEGQPVIEMEFAEGETLASRLSRGALPLGEALGVAIQIAGALGEAHGLGIVHRDLKPANIMLTKFGAKVLDFGLAKMKRSDSEAGAPEPAEDTGVDTLTMTGTRQGTILGTPYYMSPEQARGEAADGRADLFSLGVVLYEMVTGARPFTGNSTTTILSSVLKDVPAAPTRVNPGLPRELDAVLGKALEKDRGQRYQRAEELVAACTALGQTTVAPKVTRGGRRAWLWAGLSSGVALSIAAGLWVFNGQKAHALGATDTVVLADFANTTGDAVFDDALSEALAAQLTQSPFLSILSENQVRATLKLMGLPRDAPMGRDTAREVCLRAGSRAYIAGSIARLGTQYAVSLQAVDCQSTDVIARTQQTADSKEQVLHALDVASIEFRRKVGESLASVEKFAVPLQQATTPSLDALKAYSLGRKMMYDPPASIPLFQLAVRLDPNFAMAHLSLGMGFSGIYETEKGIASMQRAYELRDRGTDWERFAIESRYHYWVTGDLEKARSSYATWFQTYPREAIAVGNVGSVQIAEGNLEGALPNISEGLRLGPSPSHRGELAALYMVLDRFDEALSLIREQEKLKVDTHDDHVNLYRIAFLRHDAEGMTREVAWSADKPAWAHELLAQEAMTAAYSGRMNAARQLSRRATDAARQEDEKEVAATYDAQSGLREALFGNRTEARQRAEAALRLSHARDVKYGAGLALAAAGAVAGAQRLADDLAKRFPTDTIVQYLCVPLIRGRLAIGRKDYAQAIEILQPSERYELGYWATLTPNIYAAYVRGEAYLLGGRIAEAAVEFQKVLSHRGLTGNEPIGALARLQMARAYAVQHDTAKAKEAYQEFFDLWKEADPDVPVLKDARKEWARLQ